MLNPYSAYTYTENFTYDAADRLTGWTIINSNSYIANYSGNGNPDNYRERKSDFGLYAYSGSKPHAVSGISSLIAGTGEERTCEAEYNTIGKIKKLTLKNGSTTLKTATFTYAADGQRRKMVVGNTTTIYCDDYQVNKNGSTEQRLHYISGPTGLCALIVQTISDQHTSREIYYLQTDYQGSIIAVYYSNGILYKSFAYDPWGRRRNISNWTNYKDIDEETRITRGYCGHEHLDDFGTINMNGRIYDLRLGRFLSPDPYVQAPYNSQNYNRYSYCWNNPLKYTDPSGKIVWFIPIIAGAVIGATSGAIMAKQAEAQGFLEWAGYIGGGALIGGLSGGAAVSVSMAGGGAMLVGAVSGAVGGAGFSGMVTGWDGQAMLKGAAFGAISGFIGSGFASAIGGGIGALAGGATSNLANQLLYNNGNLSKINWKSVAISGGASFGLYHAMSFAAWKWGGGNNINGHNISYRQFTTMNADFQRSRFWNKEYGGYLLNDGSVQRFPASSRHNYQIDPNLPAPEDAFASYHTHWEKPGIEVLVNSITGDKATPLEWATGKAEWALTDRYHSEADLQFDAFVGLNSYVINRYDYSYNGIGSGIWHDPFIRFFMFPFWW